MIRNLLPQGDDYAREPTRFRRFLAWIRHCSTAALISLAALSTAILLVPSSVLHGFAAWLYLLCGFVTIALIVWMYFESVAHSGRWCDRCVHRRVSENPSEAAERADRWLRFYHFYATNRGLGSVLAAYTASLVAEILGLPMAIGHAAWMSVLVALALINAKHSWHQSHCRYCRRGGGGDDEVVPVDPTPTPSDSKPVPVPVGA